MSKKSPAFGTQLILAAVLFIFGTASYWLVYSKKPKEEAAKADEKKVFVLKSEPIRSVEFYGLPFPPKDPKELGSLNLTPLAVNLECLSLGDGLCKTEDSSKWGLVAPIKTKADDATVNGLLKNLGNLASSDTIDLSKETPEKRASLLWDYGLSEKIRQDPRTRKIRFTLKDGKSFTAYFGVKHPMGEDIFALLESQKVDENRIFLVPEWQLSVFNQRTSYFRDKKLLAVNDKEVTGFTILETRKSHGKIEATKDETSGHWTLAAGPRKVDADQDTVEGFLSGVSFLSAKDYVSEKKDSPEAKTALTGARSVFSLELRTKNGVKQLKVFGKLKDAKNPKGILTLYAEIDDQDPLAEIESFTFEKLDLGFDDFRVSKLIGISDRYAFTNIDIEATGVKKFKENLTKESTGAWKIEGKESARGRVEGILDRLTSKIVKGFSGPAPGNETIKMTFGKTPTDVSHELLFWKKGTQLFARNLRSSEKETIELMPDFSMQLPWDERFLKDANVGAEGKQ